MLNCGTVSVANCEAIARGRGLGSPRKRMAPSDRPARRRSFGQAPPTPQKRLPKGTGSAGDQAPNRGGGSLSDVRSSKTPSSISDGVGFIRGFRALQPICAGFSTSENAGRYRSQNGAGKTTIGGTWVTGKTGGPDEGGRGFFDGQGDSDPRHDRRRKNRPCIMAMDGHRPQIPKADRPRKPHNRGKNLMAGDWMKGPRSSFPGRCSTAVSARGVWGASTRHPRHHPVGGGTKSEARLGFANFLVTARRQRLEIGHALGGQDQKRLYGRRAVRPDHDRPPKGGGGTEGDRRACSGTLARPRDIRSS